MAYAEPSDMIDRYDVRTLGDLCSDDGTRIAETSLSGNHKLLTALSSASGRLLSSLLRAKRYSADDLDNLEGDSREYLKDLTCRVAFWLLWQRKPYSDDQQRLESKKQYDDIMELFKSGEAIFDLDDAKNAGVTKCETITRVDIHDNWNLWVDKARGRFFPPRRTYKNR